MEGTLTNEPENCVMDSDIRCTEDASVDCMPATEADEPISLKTVDSSVEQCVSTATTDPNEVCQTNVTTVAEGTKVDQQEIIAETDEKLVEEQESSVDIPVSWPAAVDNCAAVDDQEHSVASENSRPFQQPPAEIKTWSFGKHLDSTIQAGNSLSRISSDADFCTAGSVDESKPECSMEDSEHCSSSQSPLSYVIQLNEDSECSLPSETGTSSVHPTGFDKILRGQIDCEGESVDGSIGNDFDNNQHAVGDVVDSEDHVMEVDGDIISSDVSHAKENLAKSSKSARQRNRRVRKTKDKDEQGDEAKASKNRQRKKVTMAAELETAPDGEDTDGKKGVFEYQWPPDDRSADWYLLQEHISEFLGVLSFKRKYPDIFRRTVDINERDFLQEQGVVTEMQCDLGLTALLADEVYDIMEKDYPEKFKEYAKVLHKKEKQKAADQHRTSEVPTEKTKMELLLKKAVKSAAEFNAGLMRELRLERRAYFDLQTFEVHYPKTKQRVLPKEATAVSAHPVAVLPGQFQDYYKRYTPAELNYFPVNTALYSPHKTLRSVYAESNPVPAGVPDDNEDDQNDAPDVPDSQKDHEVIPVPSENEPKPIAQVETVPESPVLKTVVKVDEDEEPAVEPPVKKVRRTNSRKKPVVGASFEIQSCRIEIPKLSTSALIVEQPEIVTCSVCDQIEKNKLGEEEDLVTCSVCSRSGHPTCLDLTQEMIPIIKTYDWQCMECKACVKCMKPHDEEKMMFCDHCDRGYHTFCVGVEEIPEGRWECPSCTLEAASPPSKAKRGRPFKYPKPVITT